MSNTDYGSLYSCSYRKWACFLQFAMRAWAEIHAASQARPRTPRASAGPISHPYGML